MLHLEGELDHPSPTLQAGIISAALPYPDSNLHGYLANIMVQGGASGSPVFLPETGEVIGVIYASRHQVVPVDIGDSKIIGVQVPTNFSHVVPAYYLDKLISESRDELMRHVPPDVPDIAEILTQVKTSSTDKITFGPFVPSKGTG